ncbi:MAG: VUT family protein [Henriciella sp.]
MTIPFLNWSFGIIEPWTLVGPNDTFAKGIELHPLTMVTGLVFVFRDFVQRGMGHRVLVVMALAIAWSFYYAWPVIALASGIAFAISEIADWLIYTFTKYRLSTRIILSSAVAAPIDTTIFLYGADLARQMRLGDEPGNMLHWANWIVFIIGKMVGAVIVSYMIRRREDAGKVDPYDDDGFTPETAKA